MDRILILVLQIVLISGFTSILLWIITYSRVAKWWRNPVGRTIVLFAALVAGLLVPTTLSLFFNLNRTTSVAAAWADVTFIGLVSPVMCWRIVTWRRLARDGRAAERGDKDSRDEHPR